MPQPWHTVTAFPALPPNSLQVWRITVPDPTTRPDAYLTNLTPDERARASRLRAGQVRLQYVVGRSTLRFLLGNLLSLPPQSVAIATNAFGKPSTPDIFFNVTHTSDTVLIALCRESEVGIDVESLSRDVDPLEIARHSFSTPEANAIAALTDPLDRRRVFFRLWTRKEAVIKADGRGLSLSLESFEVAPVECAIAIPVNVAASSSAPAATYFVSDLYLRDDLAAAFALKSPAISLSLFEFPHGM